MDPVLRQNQVALNQLTLQQYRRKNREPCSASSWVCFGWFGSSQKVTVHTQFRYVSLASAQFILRSSSHVGQPSREIVRQQSGAVARSSALAILTFRIVSLTGRLEMQ